MSNVVDLILMSPFTLFLFIHIISLVVGFGTVLVTDFFGFLWMRRTISKTVLTQVTRNTKKLIWLGYVGLVASGVGLLIMKGYVDNLTKIKLFFVLMVGVNGIFLHLIDKRFAQFATDYQMPPSLKWRVIVAMMISQVGWWGAVLIGFIHHEWQSYIPWPDNPWLYMVYVVATFIFLTLATKIILGKEKPDVTRSL